MQPSAGAFCCTALVIRFAVSAVVAALVLGALSATAEAEPAAYDYAFTCNRTSLTADFAQRDEFPQTDADPAGWYVERNGRYPNGGWGPAAAVFPAVNVPVDAGCDDATWKRERIVATALRYLNVPGNPLGLQYRHHHIPAWDPPASTAPPAVQNADDADGQSLETWGPGRGLDCSNFTAWIYNYGLGIKFGGDVGKQYAGTAGPMGQSIPAQGPFEPGDLVYLHPNGNTDRASHVVIFLDDQHVIDSRLNAQGVAGVQVRDRTGWYRTAVLGAWRPIAG